MASDEEQKFGEIVKRIFQTDNLDVFFYEHMIECMKEAYTLARKEAVEKKEMSFTEYSNFIAYSIRENELREKIANLEAQLKTERQAGRNEVLGNWCRDHNHPLRYCIDCKQFPQIEKIASLEKEWKEADFWAWAWENTCDMQSRRIVELEKVLDKLKETSIECICGDKITCHAEQEAMRFQIEKLQERNHDLEKEIEKLKIELQGYRNIISAEAEVNRGMAKDIIRLRSALNGYLYEPKADGDIADDKIAREYLYALILFLTKKREIAKKALEAK